MEHPSTVMYLEHDGKVMLVNTRGDGPQLPVMNSTGSTKFRFPTAEEVASELKIEVSELMAWKHDFAASKHQSIEEATEAYGDFIFSGDPSVEEKILNGELKSILRANIDRLNKQQLLVLQLYYVEELNVYEIAEVLSVSTGRVSQIKSAAVKSLREMIESEVNA